MPLPRIFLICFTCLAAYAPLPALAQLEDDDDEFVAVPPAAAEPPPAPVGGAGGQANRQNDGAGNAPSPAPPAPAEEAAVQQQRPEVTIITPPASGYRRHRNDYNFLSPSPAHDPFTVDITPNRRPRNPQAGETSRDAYLTGAYERFNRLDRNGDGVISGQERLQNRERARSRGEAQDDAQW